MTGIVLEAMLWAADGVLVKTIAVPNPPPYAYRIAVLKPFRVGWLSETPEAMTESGVIELEFRLTDAPRRGGERCHYLLDPHSIPKGWRVDVCPEGQLLAEKV